MNLRNISLFAAFCTFCLLILGGYVHNTASSLACPDWPTCYGQMFPKMEGKIAIEHGHRMLATFVGFLNLLMVFFAYREKNVIDMTKVVWLSLFFVILQGVLGGITVLLKLSTLASTAHLGLSMIFFLTLIYIHHRVSQISGIDNGLREDKKYHPIYRHLSLLFLFLVFMQVLLGAFLRHTGAGSSCGLGIDNSLLCFDSAQGHLAFWPSGAPAQMQTLHRYMAAFLGVALIGFLIRFLLIIREWCLDPKPRKMIIAISLAIIFSLIAQILLGVWTVADSLAALPTTLHLGLAAFLVALLWKLNLLLQFHEQTTVGKKDSWLSNYIDLTKPKLALLVGITTLAGIILAPGKIGLVQGFLALFMTQMVIMGAGALNCYFEKDVDAKMQRTKLRPLPDMRMNPKNAFLFGASLAIVGIVTLAFVANLLTAFLTLTALLIYIFVYTPLKRKTEKAVYFGAVPGALPPLIGWTAVTGKIDLVGASLFLIVLIWQLPHFLAISLYHAEDYSNGDIRTYPELYGERVTRLLIFMFTISLVGISFMPSLLGDFSDVYLKASMVLGGIFTLLALRGVFVWPQGSNKPRAWAKSYFWGSIVYLPLLITAMTFFK